MRVIGTYRFTVFGDGREDKYSVQMRALRTPEPLVEGILPTGIAEARVGSSPGGVIATIDGDFMHLKFDIPPSTAQVTVDALFGTDYQEAPIGPTAKEIT